MEDDHAYNAVFKFKIVIIYSKRLKKLNDYKKIWMSKKKVDFYFWKSWISNAIHCIKNVQNKIPSYKALKITYTLLDN